MFILLRFQDEDTLNDFFYAHASRLEVLSVQVNYHPGRVESDFYALVSVEKVDFSFVAQEYRKIWGRGDG